MPVVTGARGGSRRWLRWRFRFAAYAVFLLVVGVALTSLRGRISEVFGLAPIRVHVISHERFQASSSWAAAGAAAGAAAKDTWAVTAQIVGTTSPGSTVALRQFLLKTENGSSLRPYSSSLPFDSTGRLAIAKAETLTGVFLFSAPREEKPSEFWWKP